MRENNINLIFLRFDGLGSTFDHDHDYAMLIIYNYIFNNLVFNILSGLLHNLSLI